MDIKYDVITFFQNTFILRRPRIAIFDDIIKIVTMFIKTVFENSRKVKKIEIMYTFFFISNQVAKSLTLKMV